MNSICLISSDINEIEQFKLVYPDAGIISDRENYILPCMEELNAVLSKTEICIIGETVNYLDEYITIILRLCKDNNTKVYNYHVSNNSSKNLLADIKIPIVYICSLLPDMRKSHIGLKISNALQRIDYNPLFISSNPMWNIYKHETFPLEILRSYNPIYELNRYLMDNISKSNADIVVMCIPGGIISSNKYNPFCDYGLLDFIIHNAVKPIYILNCIHQNTENIKAIPEPFIPYKITQHIRTDRVLDQNEYDFYVKNRNITVSENMITADRVPNIFDPNVYEKIAIDIHSVIKAEDAKK